MCGIAVYAGEGERSPEVIERMAQALSHRGPDALGWEHRPGCDLGHARLSVIDLATGDQPLSTPDGRCWINFNGEIYNYRELRTELLRLGHQFHTQSDTEVVLHAVTQWGPGALDRVRGMFAFAIWDERTHRLFAARDLFGEKPLYYAVIAGGLLIASEIKALLASGLVEQRLSARAVDAYLALGYVPPDQTIYSTVQTLPPGHYLEWDGRAVRVTRYWSPAADTRPVAVEQAAERLRELLAQAVQRQLVADVPVGAFLSGGLDSSTVVALAQRGHPEPLRTFCVGIGNGLGDEREYARAVARMHGTEHHELHVDDVDVPVMLERMAEVYDEPFADSSNIPTYMVAEFARKHVKVVLSGDGGDELFGGYGWYRMIAHAEHVRGSWAEWMVLRLASRALRDRNPVLHRRSVAAGLAYRATDPWDRAVAMETATWPAQRRSLWGGAGGAVEVATWSAPRPPESVSGLDRAFFHDLTTYLPGDILVKVDRAAMAHGLETRAPLLDRDLVEFALSVPASLKVQGMESKRLFRNACAQYWPPELHARGKQGFGAPMAVWLGRPDVQPLVQRVFGRGSALRELLPGVSSRQARGRTYRSWILLNLGLWLERWQPTI